MSVINDKQLAQWQLLVNNMARIMNVPSALIMKLDKPFMKVLMASESKDNRAKVGAQADWAKIYCGEAIRTQKPLLVPNALKEARWKDNPLIELGLISYLGHPLFLPNGQPFGTICILDTKENHYSKEFLDLIGHFKLLIENELKLFDQNEVLLKKNQELDKAYSELNDLKEQLTKSNMELENFAAIVSHDLKEPLRKVVYFSDNMISIKGEQERSDYSKQIASSIERMNNMIDAILEYSKIQKIPPKFEKVSFKKIVDDVIDDMEFLINREEGIIHCGDLPELQGDTYQLRQLVQNILSNSLKYRDKNTKPEIQIFQSPSEEGNIEIRIQDNGIGIEEKNFEKIFNPMKRLHSKSEFDGTGLGLSIVNSVMERHKGRVSLKSQPGQGTTFILHFPNLQSSDNG
jgi:signal transduction histidine kinase